MDNAFPPPGYVAVPSQVEGIEVYAPAVETQNHSEMVDFKCPRCGASTAYNVQAKQLTCDHCGYCDETQTMQIGTAADKFEFKVETIERSQQGWGIERKDLSCQRCGALVSVPPDTLAYSCPFCGSNKVIYREALQDVLRPRFLIPFKIDPQSCRQATHQWLGSSWMVPAQLRDAARVDHFSPVYLPYWTFHAVCKAQWKAQVGKEVRETYYVKGERHVRTRIHWRWEAGKVEQSFNDLLVPGTSRVNLSTLGKIDNFAVAGLVRYEPRFLAGMQAQAYDVTLEQAWDAGRQVMRDRTRKACYDRASSGHVRDFSMSLDFWDETWRYILAPVYTSVYSYGGKTYQILINGQTGKIAGPRPVDWNKIWLVIAAVLAPGALLGLVGLVTLLLQIGVVIGALGMFLLLIGLIISFVIFRQAQELEHD
jgi:predicted RNA-binding Zn-ribbon protein involved in translation (DUF1610 family)